MVSFHQGRRIETSDRVTREECLSIFAAKQGNESRYRWTALKATCDAVSGYHHRGRDRDELLSSRKLANTFQECANNSLILATPAGSASI